MNVVENPAHEIQFSVDGVADKWLGTHKYFCFPKVRLWDSDNNVVLLYLIVTTFVWVPTIYILITPNGL